MNTPPPIVSRVCTTLLGTTALSTERLKAGPRTAVYRVSLSAGRSVIVKLYAHTARRNAITEATAIRSVTGTVPVPRILGWGTTSADGATALITSDLGTRTLGSAVRSGRVTHAQALKDLGALLSRLHRVPVAPSVPRRPFFDAFSFLTRRCPSELLNRIAPALAVIADAPDPTSAVWCHGDIHFDNVVLHGLRDRCHLIDFTDAAPGRRESDVAHALVMTATHTPWDRRALIGAYPAALNQARLSAWVVLHTVRCLVHSAPGEDHALWSSRLADLTQQTPPPLPHTTLGKDCPMTRPQLAVVIPSHNEAGHVPTVPTSPSPRRLLGHRGPACAIARDEQ